MPSRATLSQQDVRFARTVLRIQREMRDGFGRMFEIDMAARGVDPAEHEFDVMMTAPSHIFEMGQIEIRKAQAELAEAMGRQVSQYWILQNVFKLSDDQIRTVIRQRRQETLEDAKYEGELERARQLGTVGVPTVGQSRAGKPL